MFEINRSFHGYKIKKNFFEGWYFKHNTNKKALCIIPGISIDKDGTKKAFIQIISNHDSHYVPYSFKHFYANEHELSIFVGKNYFSKKEIILDIDEPNLKLKGNLTYNNITPLKSSPFSPSIMGPYSYLNFLECYHGIVSLKHDVSGTVCYNKEKIVFETGTAIGYIEKDWGKSFPQSWIWVQSNQFVNTKDCSFVLSVAKIPFLGASFKGIIGVLHFKNQQIVIATYYLAKIKTFLVENEFLTVEIQQGDYTLFVKIFENNKKSLVAPMLGSMNRKITESVSSKVYIRLLKNHKLIFEDVGLNAGFEKMGVVNGTY